MAFDPDVAPRDRADFLRWYEQQTQWSEGHSYNNPAVASASEDESGDSAERAGCRRHSSCAGH